MARFALYHTDDEGSPSGARLAEYSHASTARARAIHRAAECGCYLAVVLALPEQDARVVMLVKPNGTVTRPAGTAPANERDDCKRDTGEACFCPACRAERREQRHA